MFFLALVVFALLLTLKLAAVTAISWLVVFSPLLLWLALVIVIWAFVFLIAAIQVRNVRNTVRKSFR